MKTNTWILPASIIFIFVVIILVFLVIWFADIEEHERHPAVDGRQIRHELDRANVQAQSDVHNSRYVSAQNSYIPLTRSLGNDFSYLVHFHGNQSASTNILIQNRGIEHKVYTPLAGVVFMISPNENTTLTQIEGSNLRTCTTGTINQDRSLTTSNSQLNTPHSQATNVPTNMFGQIMMHSGNIFTYHIRQLTSIPQDLMSSINTTTNTTSNTSGNFSGASRHIRNIASAMIQNTSTDDTSLDKANIMSNIQGIEAQLGNSLLYMMYGSYHDNVGRVFILHGEGSDTSQANKATTRISIILTLINCKVYLMTLNDTPTTTNHVSQTPMF